MIVKWKVEDGYANNGPHTTTVDNAEIQECETLEDAVTLAQDAIEDAFQKKVSASWDEAAIGRDVEEVWKERGA